MNLKLKNTEFYQEVMHVSTETTHLVIWQFYDQIFSWPFSGQNDVLAISEVSIK